MAGGTTDRPADGGTPTRQVRLLVLQPTPFCNIDCAYCYLANRSDKRRMTGGTLTRTAEVVLGSPFVGEHLTIVWHAGEPLVLPVAFYREALAIFAEATPAGVDVTHSFQTNGTLINGEWAAFLAEVDARVGVSIDGPARFHDRYRRNRSGCGTHAATLAGIHQLQKRDIDFHVITVLTAEALEEPDAFVDFYLENGISQVGFNIEEIEGPHTSSSLQSTGTSMHYARFMKRVLERVSALLQGKLAVREFRDTCSLIFDPTSQVRHNEQVEPLGIVSIDVDGNISTFSPELLGVRNATYGNFNFGNVHRHSLADVLLHPDFIHTRNEIEEGVRLCAESCAYYAFCEGGGSGKQTFRERQFCEH